MLNLYEKYGYFTTLDYCFNLISERPLKDTNKGVAKLNKTQYALGALVGKTNLCRIVFYGICVSIN